MIALFNVKLKGSLSETSRTAFGPHREGRSLTFSELKCAPCINNQYCSPPESNASFPVEQEDYCLSLTDHLRHSTYKVQNPSHRTRTTAQNFPSSPTICYTFQVPKQKAPVDRRRPRRRRLLTTSSSLPASRTTGHDCLYTTGYRWRGGNLDS